MPSNLTFIERMTVDSFKAQNNTPTMAVKRNPQNDKLFVTDAAGNVIAAASESALDESANVIVSLVKGNNGSEFYLLHAEGTGGVSPERTF